MTRLVASIAPTTTTTPAEPSLFGFVVVLVFAGAICYLAYRIIRSEKTVYEALVEARADSKVRDDDDYSALIEAYSPPENTRGGSKTIVRQMDDEDCESLSGVEQLQWTLIISHFDPTRSKES